MYAGECQPCCPGVKDPGNWSLRSDAGAGVAEAGADMEGAGAGMTKSLNKNKHITINTFHHSPKSNT